MPPVRQASFIGGEIAPGLFGRTNLKEYANSLRLARNMIPRQEGPLCNRAGFRYLGRAKYDTGACRLIPFVYSEGTLARNYVLEVGAGYIRFWKDGAQVLYPVGHPQAGQPIEVTTPWVYADIPFLKFTQSGQEMTICRAHLTPRRLVWYREPLSSSNVMNGVTVPASGWALYEWSLLRTLNPPAGVPTVAPGVGIGTPSGSGWPSDDTTVAKSWVWAVTAVDPINKSESLPVLSLPVTTQINTSHTIDVTWPTVAGAGEYNVYRGRNGKYGFIGSVVAAAGAGTATFHDDGQYPVYAETPPTGRNPFALLTGTQMYDNQPQVVTYHDQRLCFANAWNAPAEVEMSRVGEYRNFDRASPPKAEDAVTFNIVNRRYEEIRNLVSVRMGLLILTNATEWLVAGSEGILAQDDIALVPKARWGSSWLDPLLIGEEVLFNLDVGSTIRSMIPAIEDPGQDLTLLAQHLFHGHTITSWDYCHEPFRVVWATREDGTLLSLTYVKEHDVSAWAHHDTGNGDLFEWVCSVPEGGDNVLYALIQRKFGAEVHRHIERMTPRTKTTYDQSGCVYLDSAIYNYVSGTTVACPHLVGREVNVMADGRKYGPYTVSPGGTVTIPVAAMHVWVGLPIVAQGATLDMYSAQEELRPTRKLIKKVFAEVEASAPFQAGQGLNDPLRKAQLPDGQGWEPPAPWATPRYEGHTGLVEIPIESNWSDNGMVVWQQAEPFPLTILTLIREVEFGGS